MYYPPEVVADVCSAVNIVDIVSGYVALKKQGGNYFGLCPFHNEKSPSFSVNESKQIYHCFGCGQGGGVLSFVMKYENLTFAEALTELADRAGIALPKDSYSAQEKERAGKRTLLLQINREAATFFYKKLFDASSAPALEYLKGRGLDAQTIRRFGLGYDPKGEDNLYRHLKGLGYADDILKESGLVVYDGRSPYDKFWNRVMFPIMDRNNHVIGFGGRVMGDGKPKYLNSPETLLFDKRKNLYGLNYARRTREDFFIICEGYMDVIAMHQAGFTNAVASLGTAFTTDHAVILKRMTKKVILTYDSDAAGKKAALRAIPMLREAGISARVLDMSPHKDPDEFIKALGREAFQKRIETAKNSFLFEIQVLKDQTDQTDPDQRIRFYRETAAKLAAFDEALERDSYLDAVSREFFIPKKELEELVKSIGRAGLAKPAESSPAYRKPEKADDREKRMERLLLSMLAECPEIYGRLGGISVEDFSKGLNREVAGLFLEQLENGRCDIGSIINRFADDADDAAACFSESFLKGASAVGQAEAFGQMSLQEKEKAARDVLSKLRQKKRREDREKAESLEDMDRMINEMKKRKK